MTKKIKEIEDTKDKLIKDLGKLEWNMSTKKDCCYNGDIRLIYMDLELMIYDFRQKVRNYKYD